MLGEDRLIHPALAGFPVAWFSPTYRMLSEAWRSVAETLAPVIVGKQASEHRLELMGGGVVDMWSLDNPDTARGRKYKRVVVDEAAMAPGLEAAWQNVIRPTLTDYIGDAWFMSTPKGRGAFWLMWLAGQDQGQTDWRSWQMPTTSNPYILASEVEAARRQLPESVFAQEYLAQFIEDSGLVFRSVYQAATAEPAPAREGHSYVIGLDWGKLRDFTVISVVDADARRQVWLDRFNQIDYSVQLTRLRATIDRYPGAYIVAESNSIGEPLIERLRADGVRVHSFATTSASKAKAIEDLALAFERGEIEVLRDNVQVGELLAFEASRLPSGVMRYAAPEGAHDDCVMALAMAWSAVGHQLPDAIPGVDPFASLDSKRDGGPALDLGMVNGRLQFVRRERKGNSAAAALRFGR